MKAFANKTTKFINELCVAVYRIVRASRLSTKPLTIGVH